MTSKMEISPIEAATLAGRVADALLRMHHAAFAVLDGELVVRYVSPDLLALLHAPEMDPAGQPLTHFLDLFVGMEEVLEDVLRGESEGVSLDQVNWELPDGSFLYFSFQCLPYMPAEPRAGLLLIVEDTTALNQMRQLMVQDRNELRLLREALSRTNDQLRQANQTKSLFLSMAAHDLRAPLSVIQGYADLLEMELGAILSDDQHEFLRIISNQVDWLVQLIADLLDLDRIEQGNLILNQEPCLLEELVQESARVYALNARQKGLSLRLNLAPTASSVNIDPQRLRQVMHNLLSNAIKFCRAEDTITLSTRQEGDGVVLAVADTGPGVTAEQAGRIFDKYYRTEETRQRQVQGAGLGLYIVKSLVEAHEGRVQVISQPGWGTRFDVWLPRFDWV